MRQVKSAVKEMSKGDRRIKCVVAIPGIDGHWTAAYVVSHALRDMGAEVVYLGNGMPEEIVQTAIEEDAELIGLSFHSGTHMVYSQELINLLRAKKAGSIKIVVGGTIPSQDIRKLKEIGISEVFPAGSTLQQITTYVRKHCG